MKDLEDVNYYERLLGKIYPGIQDGNYRKDNGETGPYGAATGRAFRYTDEDYANEVLGKGRMVGASHGSTGCSSPWIRCIH